MTTQAVLLTTYPEAFLHKGGGEYELLEVALNLRKLGLVVDAYSPYSRDLDHYGTVIHFATHASGLPVAEAAKAAGKRFILWPNFWINKTEAKADSSAARFTALASAVVFKSEIEKANFANVAPLSGKTTLIVPAGVDPVFLDPTPPTLFRESFGLDEYLVWIGIFEPRKNQLGVITALRELEIPIVFIGNYREEAYYRACQAAAPEHFIFLEPMQSASDILRAAIRESRLYLEPTLEPAGKSVLEAAICGARVLVSDQPWEREHLGDFAVYVNPKDAESLREGVRQGLETPVDPDQVSTLAQKYLYPGVLEPLAHHIGQG